MKGHIEYKIKHKRPPVVIDSRESPQHIILDKGGGQWWSGFKYDRGLDIFIKPKQDMRGYFSNVKTNGYSNEKLRKIEYLIDMLKSSNNFLSVHILTNPKTKIVSGDQFVGVVSDKKRVIFVKLMKSVGY